jgi:hypothetical protein
MKRGSWQPESAAGSIGPAACVQATACTHRRAVWRRIAALLVIPLIGAIVTTACDAPVIPGRDTSDIFPFDLPTTPSTIMRWPVGSTIRVHVAEARTVEGTATLRAAFEAGARAWNATALFSEYAIRPASSLEEADVVLAFSDVTLPVSTQNCQPALTVAVTTFCIDDLGTPDASLRVFPATSGEAGRVRIIVLVLATFADDGSSVERLVAHELGHVLGIGRHSEDARDLMYRVDQVTSRPTSRDAATAQVLYHVRADIEIR